MTKLSLAALSAALLLSVIAPVQADDMTPAQLAEARVKAETAHRLMTFGRQMKDANMLLSAIRLMSEIGPVADPSAGMKDGKPVTYDLKAIADEAGSLGADPKAVDAVRALPTKLSECRLFYNCTSDNSLCWWDNWC